MASALRDLGATEVQMRIDTVVLADCARRHRFTAALDLITVLAGH